MKNKNELIFGIIASSSVAGRANISNMNEKIENTNRELVLEYQGDLK
ncbi:hypothetical protein R0K30_11785 [Bacillus sp. SIMBA_154]